jgi:hypothetical protein
VSEELFNVHWPEAAHEKVGACVVMSGPLLLDKLPWIIGRCYTLNGWIPIEISVNPLESAGRMFISEVTIKFLT